MFNFLDHLTSSNALQILITVAMGGLAYLLVRRFPAIIAIVGVAIAILLTISFALDIGEVYSYSPIYKRAYFWFGDDVTTWLTPILIWAVLSGRRSLSIAVAAGILFSGGRVAIILLLVQYAAVALIFRPEAWRISKAFWTAIGLAAIAYGTLVVSSPYLIDAGNSVAKVLHLPGLHLDATRRGNANCRTGESCLETKVSRPARMRAYSAVAGLWMTLQGGYQGSRFPNTPEKFADLMMQANPWGINDRFDISREDWEAIGTVQTPYLQFGAGYGPLLLASLVLVIGAICLIGVWNIAKGEREPFIALTLFFIVNSILNQTQAWMNPGPLLLVLGICGTHILIQFAQQTFAMRAGVPAR